MLHLRLFANRYAGDRDADGDTVQRLVRVSLETMRIVNALPALNERK